MPALLVAALLAAVPGTAWGTAAARILIEGASLAAPAAVSSGSLVEIAPVEDMTGRSPRTAAALRAALLLEALAPARGWVVSEAAPEDPHTVLAGRLTDDAGSLRAYLFIRRSTETRIIGGAATDLPWESGATAAASATSPTPPTTGGEAAPPEGPRSKHWNVAELWRGTARAGRRHRVAVFGGLIERRYPGRQRFYAGAALRSPSERLELVLDGGAFMATAFGFSTQGGHRTEWNANSDVLFARVHPAIRRPLGRLPWCGFSACPRVVLEGGPGLALLRLQVKYSSVVILNGVGPRSIVPETTTTFLRMAPFAAAGVALELNQRLELGLHGEYVLTPDRLYGISYGGTALGARLTLLFP